MCVEVVRVSWLEFIVIGWFRYAVGVWLWLRERRRHPAIIIVDAMWRPCLPSAVEM